MSTKKRKGEAIVLVGVEATTGIAALGGMAYALGGAEGVPSEWLESSPFKSYVGPGLILGGAVGGSNLAAAWSTWRRRPNAATFSLIAGLVVVGWITAQVAIIGPRSWLQPLFFLTGVLTLVLARRLFEPGDEV
jgi:peptidoglycan/LPS O-acetylase OafA/YrhL